MLSLLELSNFEDAISPPYWGQKPDEIMFTTGDRKSAFGIGQLHVAVVLDDFVYLFHFWTTLMDMIYLDKKTTLQSTKNIVPAPIKDAASVQFRIVSPP